MYLRKEYYFHPKIIVGKYVLIGDFEFYYTCRWENADMELQVQTGLRSNPITTPFDFLKIKMNH